MWKRQSLFLFISLNLPLTWGHFLIWNFPWIRSRRNRYNFKGNVINKFRFNFTLMHTLPFASPDSTKSSLFPLVDQVTLHESWFYILPFQILVLLDNLGILETQMKFLVNVINTEHGVNLFFSLKQNSHFRFLVLLIWSLVTVNLKQLRRLLMTYWGLALTALT